MPSLETITCIECDRIFDAEKLAERLGVADVGFGPDFELICDDHEHESPVEDDVLDWRREMAMEAGMAGGTDAYNETMGWDTSAPEPCGHHCPSDCPRCGDND